MEVWEGRPPQATPQEQKPAPFTSRRKWISLAKYFAHRSPRGTLYCKVTSIAVVKQHTTLPPPFPRSANLLFLCKDALETIDIIGEVDVAYTHDSISDDYIYDIWFKASVVLAEWVFHGQGSWVIYSGGQAGRGRRKPRDEKTEPWVWLNILW